MIYMCVCLILTAEQTIVLTINIDRPNINVLWDLLGTSSRNGVCSTY